MAEEVRDPGRTIPRALILSLAVVSVLYVLMVLVTSGVMGADELDFSLTPISDGARVIMGRGGYYALSVAAILAFVSTANAGIMSASRYLYALSRDRLLPPALSRVTVSGGAPWVAISVTGGLIAVSLFLKLDVLVEAASTVLILSNILACLSVVVLRESRLQNYRPAFHAPFYPWLQIGGIIGFGMVLTTMGLEAYLICAGLVMVGVLTYWYYGRSRVQGESALLHLLERLTAKELVTGTLESELKTIIRDRDEISLDRFDEKIEQAAVLDYDGPVTMETFFADVAERLADRLGVDRDQLQQKLIERESQSSTHFGPNLAIPHVIVDGEQTFEILLARSAEGIELPDADHRAQAVFVLVGSADERNFHLRALAAIAQVVQQEHFEKRWLGAKTRQGLRDLVLLGPRRRAGH